MNGDGQGFYGKYLGTVTDNNDPEQRGRIRAKAMEVFGDDDSGWALPSAPFGGTSQTGLFAVPPVGATVWLEFLHGDSEYPVWSGCFWSKRGDVPPEFQASPPDQVMIVTSGGNKLILSDASGAKGITLETSQGAKLAITENGIELDNGQGATIKLTGKTVSVNDGALEVT